MTTTFELYDYDGVTLLAPITGVGGPSWSNEWRGPGAGALDIHHDHALASSLVPGRWIKVTHTKAGHPDTYKFTWLLEDHPATIWSARGDLITKWSGPGNLAVMGWGNHDEAVVVENEPNGLAVFGWIADEWDTSTWTSPAPYSGGHYLYPRNSAWKNSPDNFPDDRAEWIISQDSNNPTGPLWVRHRLAHHAARDGASLYIAGEAKAWLNGEEVYDGDSATEMTRLSIDLTGDDLLAVRLEGRAIWTIGHDGDDGEFVVLYRSSTGLPFPTNTDETQSIVLDVDHPPFPWGSDYPSTGPDNLQGTWRIKFDGQWTSKMQWDNNANDVKAHLEALSNVDTVTVTGSGTSASPYLVTFPGAGDVATMQLDHSDLRHAHATTAVNVVTGGRTVFDADPWRHTISVTDTQPTGVTYGYVMTRLMDWAQNDPERGAIPMVTTTATDTHDSNGVEWSVSLPYVAYDAGLQLGSVLQLGWQQFHAHCAMTHDFQLLLLDAPGEDLSGSVQLTSEQPEAPDNVLAWAMSNPEPPGPNVLLVMTDGGTGWYEHPDPPVEGRRRESAASLGNALTVEEAESAALGILEDHRPRRKITGRTGEFASPTPLLDYGVGDTVGARRITEGAYLPSLVSLLTCFVDDGGTLLVDVEAIEYEGA